MVFKIISVGSIPAILDIILLNSIKKKKYNSLNLVNKKPNNTPRGNQLPRFTHVINFSNNANSVVGPNSQHLNLGAGQYLINHTNYTLGLCLYFLANDWDGNNYKITSVCTSANQGLTIDLNFLLFNIHNVHTKLPNKLIDNKQSLSYTKFNGFPPRVSTAYSPWVLMRLIRTLTKSFAKRFLLGIYAVSSSYFLSNSVYFPSLDNVRVFNSLNNLRFEFGKGDSKFFPSISLNQVTSFNSNYSKHSHIVNNVSLSSNFLTKFLNLISSNELKLPLKIRKKAVYYFFKFSRKKLFFRKINFLRKLSSAQATISKLARLKKSFSLLNGRINFFDKFRLIYNPSKASAVSLAHKAIYTVFKRNQPNRSILQKNSLSTALSNNYLGKVTHSLTKCFPILSIMWLPFLLKVHYFFSYSTMLNSLQPNVFTNLTPCLENFNKKLMKNIYSSQLNSSFRENVTPWVYNTLIRFMEFHSGKKVSINLYSFMSQSIDPNYVALYKSWLPRFSYYERRLGHRFFLEEALQILHMGFNYQDSKLISSWLKSIIHRISFWKTRFIFRFIRYLFNNYFQFMFKELGVKGFKVKLKGKISVAGNSRKRSILYRIGKTSHASNNLKVVHTTDTIVTFTGVMGFQVWIFY